MCILQSYYTHLAYKQLCGLILLYSSLISLINCLAIFNRICVIFFVIVTALSSTAVIRFTIKCVYRVVILINVQVLEKY